MSRTLTLSVFALTVMVGSFVHLAAQSDARYDVTVTNLTKGQTFTPLVIATHAPGVRIFAPGTQASPQLTVLAEEGAPEMMVAMLRGMPTVVREVVTATGLQTPAVSATFQISGGGTFSQLSIAAMLIPTNDAFLGLSGLSLPIGTTRSSTTVPPAEAVLLRVKTRPPATRRDFIRNSRRPVQFTISLQSFNLLFLRKYLTHI